MRALRLFCLVFVSAMVLSFGWALPASAEPGDFVLSARCPQSFELVAGNRCELRTLYQFYGSTQNRGIGGTHTGLPAHRDGFSPQQIDLGRYLFFDPLLSADNRVACASCHQPAMGFADGRALSLGVNGAVTERSAPTLWNVAFLTSFFWDARADSLELQAQGPLYSEKEMATTPAELLRKLSSNSVYPGLFAQAFAGEPALTLNNIYTALTAFQTSLVSLNSRYDQYAHGDHSALSEVEIEGMNVFRSFVSRCAECHSPPLFTNNQVAVIGAPEPDGKPLDAGAELVVGDPRMRAGFKVPSLRNIALTAPYMHSGVFGSLRETVAFYTGGRGHAVPPGEDLLLHWHIWEPRLADAELDLLVTFLRTLTDQSAMPVIPERVPSGLTPTGTEGSLALQNSRVPGRPALRP